MKEVLVVCAHPDDESFGLGAVLAALSDRGTRARVLCFTQGEASTLGGRAGRSVAEVRASELAAAAAVLGIDAVELLPYPDGHLDEIPLEELADLVGHAVADAEALVVFDEGGITGHPDHRRATAAALLAASRHRRLAVIADHVAGTLNAELGTTFVGRSADELDLAFAVDRARSSLSAGHPYRCPGPRPQGDGRAACRLRISTPLTAPTNRPLVPAPPMAQEPG